MVYIMIVGWMNDDEDPARSMIPPKTCIIFHKTRSPPPPPVQYGWKNAIRVKPFVSFLSPLCVWWFSCRRRRKLQVRYHPINVSTATKESAEAIQKNWNWSNTGNAIIILRYIYICIDWYVFICIPSELASLTQSLSSRFCCCEFITKKPNDYEMTISLCAPST
jgi:hypothetical protein